MAVCYKINETQTECCNPVSDTCSISGEGPFPQGPVGLNSDAVSRAVGDVIRMFKDLLSGKKADDARENVKRK